MLNHQKNETKKRWWGYSIYGQQIKSPIKTTARSHKRKVDGQKATNEKRKNPDWRRKVDTQKFIAHAREDWNKKKEKIAAVQTKNKRKKK